MPHYNIEFVPLDCTACGCMYALTREMCNRLGSNGNTFYCPNGHKQNFGETIEQELRAQLALEAKNREWVETQLANTEQARRTIKGQLTNLKNRVGNGVCPCCNRTVSQLAQHMASKHPDFKNDESDTPTTVDESLDLSKLPPVIELVKSGISIAEACRRTGRQYLATYQMVQRYRRNGVLR